MTKKLNITPGTNIRWERVYEVSRHHWALVSDESVADGKVISAHTVLLASYDNAVDGSPLNKQGDLALYANAHNTYNSCQMLPSELRAIVQRVYDELDRKHGNGTETEADTELYLELGLIHGYEATPKHTTP